MTKSNRYPAHKGVKQHAPKIKVLGHVDLLEDPHQALLLAGLVDLVARWYSKHLRFLAMIHVVPAKKRHRRSLCDKYHIPTRGEPQETYPKLVTICMTIRIRTRELGTKAYR